MPKYSIALLIAWNIFDAFVHIRTDMVEPLRISGNTIAIIAAIIVLTKYFKRYSSYLINFSAATITILNALHAFQNGVRMPMLIFIGLTLFLLLNITQSIKSI